MRYTLQLEDFVNEAHRLLDVDLFGIFDLTKPLTELFQPMTIYLIVFCSRLIRERRKGSGERKNWKELAKI